jgi:hypothetical protein
LFQTAQTFAQRRLRQTQRLGRTCEALVLGNDGEVLDVT